MYVFAHINLRFVWSNREISELAFSHGGYTLQTKNDCEAGSSIYDKGRHWPLELEVADKLPQQSSVMAIRSKIGMQNKATYALSSALFSIETILTSDQPTMTPVPMVNSNGVPRSRDESNFSPFSKVPT